MKFKFFLIVVACLFGFEQFVRCLLQFIFAYLRTPSVQLINIPTSFAKFQGIVYVNSLLLENAPNLMSKRIDRTFPEGFMRIRDQNPNAPARAFVRRPCHFRKCLGIADGWNNSSVSSSSSSSQQQLGLMQCRSHPSGDFWCWRKLGRFVEEPAPSGFESWVKQAYRFLSLDAPVVQKFAARGVGIFPFLPRVGCVSLPLGDTTPTQLFIRAHPHAKAYLWAFD